MDLLEGNGAEWEGKMERMWRVQERWLPHGMSAMQRMYLVSRVISRCYELLAGACK
jgi:hypothetical protein